MESLTWELCCTLDATIGCIASSRSSLSADAAMVRAVSSRQCNNRGYVQWTVSRVESWCCRRWSVETTDRSYFVHTLGASWLVHHSHHRRHHPHHAIFGGLPSWKMALCMA